MIKKYFSFIFAISLITVIAGCNSTSFMPKNYPDNYTKKPAEYHPDNYFKKGENLTLNDLSQEQTKKFKRLTYLIGNFKIGEKVSKNIYRLYPSGINLSMNFSDYLDPVYFVSLPQISNSEAKNIDGLRCDSTEQSPIQIISIINNKFDDKPSNTVQNPKIPQYIAFCKYTGFLQTDNKRYPF